MAFVDSTPVRSRKGEINYIVNELMSTLALDGIRRTSALGQKQSFGSLSLDWLLTATNGHSRHLQLIGARVQLTDESLGRN